MKEVFKKPWEFTVLIDEATNTHYVQAVCGGAGMYEVRMQLTSEEIAETQGEWGKLDALVLKMCRDPKAFGNRLKYL